MALHLNEMGKCDNTWSVCAYTHKHTIEFDCECVLFELSFRFSLLTYSKQNKQTREKNNNNNIEQSGNCICTNRIKIAANQVYLPFRSAHTMLPMRSDETEEKTAAKWTEPCLQYTYKSSPIFLLTSSCVPNIIFLFKMKKKKIVYSSLK